MYELTFSKELACEKVIDLLFESAMLMVEELGHEKNDLMKEFAKELLKGLVKELTNEMADGINKGYFLDYNGGKGLPLRSGLSYPSYTRL